MCFVICLSAVIKLYCEKSANVKIEKDVKKTYDLHKISTNMSDFFNLLCSFAVFSIFSTVLTSFNFINLRKFSESIHKEILFCFANIV